MTFSRLLEIVKTFGNLDKDFISNIHELNKARVKFAHPKDKKYLIYKDMKEYKAALKNIKKILDYIEKRHKTMTVKVKKKNGNS